MFNQGPGHFFRFCYSHLLPCDAKMSTVFAPSETREWTHFSWAIEPISDERFFLSHNFCKLNKAQPTISTSRPCLYRHCMDTMKNLTILTGVPIASIWSTSWPLLLPWPIDFPDKAAAARSASIILILAAPFHDQRNNWPLPKSPTRGASEGFLLIVSFSYAWSSVDYSLYFRTESRVCTFTRSHIGSEAKGFLRRDFATDPLFSTKWKIFLGAGWG